MPAKSQNTPSPEKLEDALERLDTIVQEMEKGGLPLDDLLSRYEEGVRLVKFSQEKLDAAEKRIEIITRTASGSVSVDPFPTDEE